MNIREALAQMDTLDNDQWTADGSPKVDTVSEILGRTTTRKEITDAAPHFTRENTDGIDADGTTTDVVPENASGTTIGAGVTPGVAVPATDVVAGVEDKDIQPTDAEGARTDLVEDQKNQTIAEDVDGNPTNLEDSKKTVTITEDVNGNPTDLLDGDLVQGDAGVLTDDVNDKSDQQRPISHPNHSDVLPKDDPELSGAFDDFLSQKPMEPAKFSEYLSSVDAEDLDELKVGLNEQLSDLRKQKAELEADEYNIRQAQMLTKARINREVPDVSDAESNRAFLNSQHHSRMRRKETSDALLKGIDKDSLDPRAPIDRAMARSSGRGGKRPNYYSKG